MANFVIEFTNFQEVIPKGPEKEPWQVYVDGSSCCVGGGMDVHMVASDGVESYHAIQLNFKVTNNEAEYKAVLAGLAIVTTLGGEEVEMKTDS